MIINIQDDILKLHAMGLLDRLLADKSTKKNIVWATDAFTAHGVRYERNEQILSELITGVNAYVIRTRARKELEQQFSRTRSKAEVFTPLWVTRKMIDYADGEWFGREGAFDAGRVEFDLKNQWQKYVEDKRLEIACGEAPFLVTRYDVETGEMIPVRERIGILDRKLRVVSENAKNEQAWLLWAMRALQTTYGYEYQGDNLLIARVNILMTFEEYMQEYRRRKPTAEEYKKIIEIITWNIWQMDALSGTVPYVEEPEPQTSLFEELEPLQEPIRPICRVMNWSTHTYEEFNSLGVGGNSMKFDFIIGNPPYQDDTVGANNQAKPIYHLFMESAYFIGDVVELITPARFLTRAGATPKEWNLKMLNDPHFKVIFYFEDSSIVFNGVDIKGGVAISYYSSKDEFKPIEIFVKKEELRSIFDKVKSFINENIGDLVHSPDSYRFTDKMFSENPFLINRTDKAHAKAVASSVFDRYPEIFREEEKPGDVKVIGRKGNARRSFFTKCSYLNDPGNVHCWKILVAGAIGTGAFGEALSDPLVVGPETAHTQTFVSMGEFKTRCEAESLAKYIKTRFARTMLGIMKTTQNNQSKVVWSKIPLQDFTPASDIDWSKSVYEIDQLNCPL